MERKIFVRVSGGDSAAMLFLRLLINEGVTITVDVDGQTYGGLLHSLAWKHGDDHVSASAFIPLLSKNGRHLNVAIYSNGRVVVIPDEA